MDNAELRTALSKHFAPEGFTTVESGDLDLELTNGAERWGLTLCADREEGMAYLGAFEAAMQRMVDAHQAGDANLRLGIGIAFGSTAGGPHPSFRRGGTKNFYTPLFFGFGVCLF